MKSIEFILEDDWEDSQREYNEMEAKIATITKEYGLNLEQVNFAWEVKEDCQTYLRQNPSSVTRSPLYRGIHSSQDTLKKKVHIAGRRPLDSSRAVHELLNDAFKTLYGQPFRNAMFATNDMYQADNYGEIYIVFPIGNFSFLWSPEIEDIFTEYENKDYRQTDEEFVDEIVKGHKYFTNDLARAVDVGNEIMIRCDSYYAIRKSSLELNQMNGIQTIIDL